MGRLKKRIGSIRTILYDGKREENNIEVITRSTEPLMMVTKTVPSLGGLDIFVSMANATTIKLLKDAGERGLDINLLEREVIKEIIQACKIIKDNRLYK